MKYTVKKHLKNSMDAVVILIGCIVMLLVAIKEDSLVPIIIFGASIVATIIGVIVEYFQIKELYDRD